MYLLVTANGGKWWRIDYRFAGKRQTLSLGIYPAVSLKDARNRRAKIRGQLAAGIDPSVHRKVERLTKTTRAANSFELVAREWHAKHAPGWAASHEDKIIRRAWRRMFSPGLACVPLRTSPP